MYLAIINRREIILNQVSKNDSLQFDTTGVMIDDEDLGIMIDAKLQVRTKYLLGT